MTNIEKFLKSHGFRLKISHEQAKRVAPDISGIYEKGYISVTIYPNRKLWVMEDAPSMQFDSIRKINEFRRLFKSLDTALRQIENPWEEPESHPVQVVHHTVFTIDVPEEKYPRGTVLKIHDALKEIGVLETTKIDGYSKEEKQ